MSWAGQRCEITLGFWRSDGYDAAKLLTLANFIATWWYNSWRLYQRNNVTLTEVYARALDSNSAPVATSTLYSGTQGSRTGGNYMPQNVAWVISFRTALRGRANRGRNYIPLSSQDYYAAPSSINSSGRDGYLAVYRALLPGGSSDPTPNRWCVISRQLDGVVQGRAVPITAVVAVNDVLDSQRRRLPGRGL